jgi:predicted site-specific integrase-resolvase
MSFFGVSRHMVKRWQHEGLLATRQIGGRIFITAESVETAAQNLYGQLCQAPKPSCGK